MTPSRFRQVEAFRAVLHRGSVSRAAEALSLSQPAVTKLLRALEDDTGLALFDRSRRRLVPTPEAASCEDAIERLFAAADRLDQTIDEMRSVGSGALRVAAMPFFGTSFIPGLLARFARDHDLARVSVSVTTSRDVHNLVEAGEVDLGFALSSDSRSTLVTAPPIALPGLLALPRGHRLASLRAVPLRELEGEPFISLGWQYRLRDLVDELFERHGVAPRLVAETQSAAAACAMAAAGLGFTVADPISIKAVAKDVAVRTLTPTTTFLVTVLAPGGQPLSSTATQFLNIVRQELASPKFGAPRVRSDGERRSASESQC